MAGALVVAATLQGCAAMPLPAPVASTAAAVPAASVPEPTPLATFSHAGQLTQGGWIRGTAPSGTLRLRLGDMAVPIADGGLFFAAFDRDAGPAELLVATLADGREVSLPLPIAPRAWNIEHVNTAKRPGAIPDAAFQALREQELGRIAVARAMDTGSMGWRQDFVWPAVGRISGRFGSQRIYRGEPGSYHSGLDIATGTTGTPFVAPADGTVVLAAEKPFTLEGHLLIIDHGMGLNSAFLHCSALLVKAGDRVKRGQEVGRIGATGRASGPHLHWSLRWRDRRLDPLLLVGRMP